MVTLSVLIEPAFVVQASIAPPQATNGSLSQVGLSAATRVRSAVNGPATTLIGGHAAPEMSHVQGLDGSLHEASLLLVVHVPSPEAQSCSNTSRGAGPGEPACDGGGAASWAAQTSAIDATSNLMFPSFGFSVSSADRSTPPRPTRRRYLPIAGTVSSGPSAEPARS